MKSLSSDMETASSRVSLTSQNIGFTDSEYDASALPDVYGEQHARYSI